MKNPTGTMGRWLMLVPIILLAVGCGGGGGGDADAPAAQAALPIVGLYGDSTQQAEGYSATSAASEAQKLLVGIATLQNEGVPGTMTEQLLEGTDGKHRPWPQELARSPARLVVMNHAINDYLLTVDQYRGNLVALVRLAKQSGKVMMLETPNPIQTSSFSVADFAAKVQAMRDVAAQESVPLCDQYAAIMQAGLQEDNLDGYHPTPHLFAFKGQVLATCIRAAIR